MPWHGPYQIRTLLEMAIDDDRDFPQESNGIYVITRKAWQVQPAPAAEVLYVGGNTGKSKRFRTRIGDLIADLCGFFGTETAHHSGGQSLWKWCRHDGVPPLDLYLGWQSKVRCNRCAEIKAYKTLQPQLNKSRPPRCPEHP